MSEEEQLQEKLAHSRIAADLVLKIKSSPDDKGRLHVIIEFNAEFPGGEGAARLLLLTHILQLRSYDYADILRPSWMAVSPLLAGVRLKGEVPDIAAKDIERFNSMLTERYLFAELTRAQIFALSKLLGEGGGLKERTALVHKIWLDQEVTAQVNVSSRTIKSDAARAAFNSAGQGVVWAVADTGIMRHPHFDRYENLELRDGLRHWDFTQSNDEDPNLSETNALTDDAGHGTHVAGIIAGSTLTKKAAQPVGIKGKFLASAVELQRSVRTNGEVTEERDDQVEFELCGIAPRCKLVSLKVMNGKTGQVSRLLAAIGYVQLLNGYGRHLKIHGLNLSVGYEFDPKSFAAGQSPLCQEVDRLVKSGVVVVVAAGNGGYGQIQTTTGFQGAAHGSTIADPGNAELAITVGSTHREMPHTYGVSFFSAKGPTADGRMKPDIVAPGERILSCSNAGGAVFREESGTSMAAPHVSGAIAAFLSVRREFQGRPEQVKALFKQNATDIGRQPEFQGAGLVDLMRTLQAV